MIEDRCRREVADLVDAGIAGASLAVVLPGGELVTVAAGWADADTREPLTPGHLLLSGSVGKTYVSAVAQHLVQAGRLDLDRPLVQHFARDDAELWDRLPGARLLTLRQLLTHTSGLPRYVFDPAFGAAIASDPERRWTPAECLAFVFDAEPVGAPGERFAYADTNYLLVGMAIEEVTGRAFYDLAREWLLEPHGLSETLPTDRADVPGVAQGHVVLGRAMGVGPRSRADGRFTYNVQFEWCGGGWASTPRDLALWARLFASGRALPAGGLARALESVPAEELEPGLRYGHAVMVRDTPLGPWLGHDGTMPGYLTSMGHLPDAGLSLALMVNQDDPRTIGRRLPQRLVDVAVDVAAVLAD